MHLNKTMKVVGSCWMVNNINKGHLYKYIFLRAAALLITCLNHLIVNLIYVRHLK